MTLTDPTLTDPSPSRGAIDEELNVAADEMQASRQKFEALVRRLSEQSVTKHYDAYADIPWDEPEFAVDQTDPRWRLPSFDTLGATEWYQSLDPDVQARLGLYRVAAAAKIGMQFENVLKRGLLEHTFFHLEDRDPKFRYIYHEVAEETHHGMMFQEFVDRTEMKIPGMPLWLKLLSQQVIVHGRWFPELFFIFVLGGEDPIDHIQRETLRADREIPPILDIIMRHHVTEEARHLSFARHYLKQQVPHLPWWKRQVLSIGAPIILGIMALLMLAPPRRMVRTYDIPSDVLREAYLDNPVAKQRTCDSVRKVRKLCRELGIVNVVSKQIWKRLGIWADD